MFHSDWRECRECGDDIHIERWGNGYRLCLMCGEQAAQVERKSWTVVQEYQKGGYMYVTKAAISITLKQTNQKNLRSDI
jgi:hypothetical protein